MSTPLTNAQVATAEDITDGSVALLGWMPTGPYNVPTVVQIPFSAYVTGLPLTSVSSAVQLNGTTSGLNSTVLSGMPTLPASPSALRFQGTVTAYNSASGDTISWDVTGLIKYAGSGGNAVLLNGSTAQYYADSDMMGCTLTVGVSGLQATITFTGLTATSITITAAILFSPLVVLS
jgi:hypothetical protein